MSIFEVLKYHVSDPPSQAELEALPPALYHRWASTISCTDKRRVEHITRLLYLRKRVRNPSYHVNIERLKQMLLEYDEYL